MNVKQKNLIGIGFLALVVLAITGIVLISGCINTEGKNKNIPDTFDNNTTINNSNTTEQISNNTNKTDNIAINTTNTTANISTSISNTTINNTMNNATSYNTINDATSNNTINDVTSNNTMNDATSNNTINDANNKTDGNAANTSSNKNITNTSISTNTPETPVQTTTIKTTIKNIGVEEAHKLTEENSDNENFVIIDIRTPSEFNSGHIKDAINIDYYDNDFVERLNDLDKSKTYLIYCQSGHRSGNAMENFQQLKFGLVYNILRGINSWRAKGFPVQ